MDAAQCSKELVDKIVPQLSELGFEGFVLAAYHRTTDGDGKYVITKQVIVNGGNNMLMQDGLMPLVLCSRQWHQGAL